MPIAQNMARVRCDEIQTQLDTPGLPIDDRVRLSIELFPLFIIMGTGHDLTWWKPEGMCPLADLAEWIYLQDNLEP
jgi:hypothetical protein